jgi:hypothetical protein
MINLKKMDALKFVQSLPGGWDTIIFDPPYYDESMKINKRQIRNIFEYKLDHKRTFLDDKYLLILINEIVKKINENNCVVIKWYNRPIFDADYVINWYKGTSNLMGGFVKKNTEYANIYFIGKKRIDKNILLLETESFPVKITFNDNRIPFEKPIKLTKKILQWCKAKYVLDPFAGSFNSAKACNRLNIKIDACDKYLDPPNLIKSNLLNYD